MSTTTADAVVIGAGHNGLVAAAALADAGWDVVVLEANAQPGGAVRSAELVPGYSSDLYSAFYPLGASSPAIRSLELERHGLRWVRSPAVYGHARSATDENAPVVHNDVADTAAGLAEHDPRDADAWIRLFEDFQRIKKPLLDAFFGAPFPPVRAGAALAKALGPADMLRYIRFMALPARVMAHETFRSDAARCLLLGNAMHGDAPVDAPVSGAMGYLLTMLAQDVGYPVPEGGASALIDALVRRAGKAQLRCDTPVTRIGVENGRATTVHTAAGDTIRARRAIIANVSAPALYETLLPAGVLPRRVHDDLEKFEWDTPVVKINYALDRPIPWRSKSLSLAGTVHLGADDDGLLRWMTDLTTNVLPKKPFMLFGQMTTADPTRSPAGTESAWAYTHLPRGVTDNESADTIADRAHEVLEEHAPGFDAAVVGRVVQRPNDMAAADANLFGGAVNGGTAQIQQQLIFRPIPGLGRPETPVEGLFLGSASAHPGGGVHGAAGMNAARAALGQHGLLGPIRKKVTSSLLELVTRPPGPEVRPRRLRPT
ncbi:NAD(P)/FAD-dependent oxidoreductase [Rhodococcus sp. BP-252]|uniref:Pyridine nucleotide-disulfide oxidoreductase domain-containing protein 2 n=1 Tax=Rhodococcoides kyotonense TaxID=398843 RepID=A0A177YH25_9NOCA|nr:MULTISPECIES: NAD(P)/FAD-dependent oxidoreductase [Rhodococcus]MBY6414167.1 NAD(P)/FAD-dependent oxidoreductase [Rhodococcus sp. BP-320]MBY6418969.1 NAD(P)/FAD-dependent oxidoreductase [Rhodococcus sp. BP-321]MBY6423722.1 NAD(P)/FAD-dependent oxidoreductase [Rhodococcus sp. BP-324]MBY6428972.1 NAD(P)/FAD-dependent oxidoreductase [Rhodococcus sp. BP-323]MBY6433977.1 NAD(P)/FAD-dependent oxidoreductase [Rhodococcus sp. BP-322]